MSCNAWNHRSNCTCDLAVAAGGSPRHASIPTRAARSAMRGLLLPVPYDGQVYFDDLGPPWPKHWDDLRYFTKAICNVGYEELPELAPTQGMLDEYKKRKGAWSAYAEQFLDLMALRKIEKIDRSRVDGGCLLRGEDKPHHCHRRLVAEYLKSK